MRTTAIGLDFAKEAFEAFPNNETAGVYLRTLMEYEADDMIGDDTFLDGLADIAVYLNPKMVKTEREVIRLITATGDKEIT